METEASGKGQEEALSEPCPQSRPLVQTVRLVWDSQEEVAAPGRGSRGSQGAGCTGATMAHPQPHWEAASVT